ncbi:MAG: type II toxin-antitoxin system HicA family toxin [Candidatus Sungbacteria bacterium]|nr:type II toxin-antitoxin system HicA family toxin [Candidatus Sungbacteria bacterium]
MSILPMISSRALLRVLLKAGFKIVRQGGSHIRLQHFRDVTRQTTIPYHNADIPRWLLNEILKQAKFSVKEFLKLLKRTR